MSARIEPLRDDRDHAPIEATAGPALAVVVPMHNEADNVSPLLTEITASLAGGPAYEIIVVDDGSADGTASEVGKFASTSSVARLVQHNTCRGQSTAIVSGVRAAKAPIIVLLDGDMQNDPADIPALLERFANDADRASLGCITGHRVNRRDTWSRRVASRIANFARSRVLGDGTADTGCGLKLIRRSVFMDLPCFDHMHRFLPALVMRAGFRIISIPVNHRPRAHGKSHYNNWRRFWVGVVDLAGVAWLGRRKCIAINPEERQ